MTHFFIVAGKGDILLSHDLILRDVLHVPKLSAKLLSIHKLTTDLQCLVTFSPTLCKFQDQGTGKIRLAREENGPTFLRKLVGHVALKVNFHCLCCQSRFLPTIKTSGCVTIV